jgi:hypothetical protein
MESTKKYSRENLEDYLSSAQARKLGFEGGTEVSGYFKPSDRLYAYYLGEAPDTSVEGQGCLKTMVLTDGNSWFVGAGRADTQTMLLKLVDGIQGEHRAKFTFEGDELGSILRNPEGLPSLKPLKEANEMPSRPLSNKRRSLRSSRARSATRSKRALALAS